MLCQIPGDVILHGRSLPDYGRDSMFSIVYTDAKILFKTHAICMPTVLRQLAAFVCSGTAIVFYLHRSNVRETFIGISLGFVRYVLRVVGLLLLIRVRQALKLCC